MYIEFYGLTGKPFQLKPDPSFFYGSKGHSRAMAYLQYGLSQDEGFIVITGEVGAGKTTLVRNLCQSLPAHRIVVGTIVNSALHDSVDVLRMVLAAYRQPFENISKAAMLMRLELLMKECHSRGKRLLLIVDEAQNLSRPALEELRMLSNVQVGDVPMLQTFLLGQPEFRATMMSPEMTQLRQRVRATYHLGPLDQAETRAYIEYRLTRVGWLNDPQIDEEAHEAIYLHSGGIPRSINTLCDRLLLMGYLEERHYFGEAEVQRVIEDIDSEFGKPPLTASLAHAAPAADAQVDAQVDAPAPGPLPAWARQAGRSEAPERELQQVEARVERMESSLVAVLDGLRKLMGARVQPAPGKEG